MATKTMISPLTGRLTTYIEYYALISAGSITVAPDAMATMMNSKLHDPNNGYGVIDADVDEIKISQGFADQNIQAHIWIADTQTGALTTSLSIAVAIIVLGLIVLAIIGAVVIYSLAQAIMERFYPQAKFIQKDLNGNPVSYNSLAEYITCQEQTHPGKFVCHYCGQVFETMDVRDTHEQTCPWKEGVPGAPPSWTGALLIGIGAVVLIAGIWGVSKIFGREKGPPIIVTR